MVDSAARKKTAETARRFVAGQISNFEFENRTPATEDPAVWAIEDTFWCLYDDFYEHKLTDGWKIPEDVKRMMARWVMFLYSDEEYQWPKISYPGLRPKKYGIIGRLFQQHKQQDAFLNAGDYSVWPFICKESYDRARNNPHLLAGVRLP